MQLALIVVVLLIGVVFGIVTTLQWDWLAGLSTLCCGIYVAVAIFLEEWNPKESVLLAAITAVILIMSIMDVFIFSDAFDPELQAANNEALVAFYNMEGAKCSITPELTALQEKGRSKCVTQNYFAMSDAVLQFGKALYTNPPSSLIDVVFSSLTQQNKPQSCGEIFKKAYSLCPDAFISVSKETRNKFLSDN